MEKLNAVVLFAEAGDMFCDLYGEENPRQIEDYGGTGMTMGGIT